MRTIEKNTASTTTSRKASKKTAARTRREIELPSDLLKQAESMAKKRGITLDSYVNMAVDRFLAEISRTSAAPPAITIERIEHQQVTEYVIARIMVPADHAALLAVPGHYTRIPAAIVFKGDEADRAKGWNRPTRGPARKTLLARIMKLPRDTELATCIPADEWKRIGKVCRILKIKPVDWMLASIEWNASLERKKQAAA